MELKFLPFPYTDTHPLVTGQELLQGNINSQASLLSLLPGEAAAGLQKLVGLEVVK